MKRSKKGFTIVELVIVIAVIAILAAVLIPTFSSLIEKANESSDIQAVREMNIALMNEEALTGEKPADIGEAADIIAKAGYNVRTYHPLSKNAINYWYKPDNRVVLYKGSEEKGEIIFPQEYRDQVVTNDGNWSLLNETYTDAINYDFSDAETESGKGYDLTKLKTDEGSTLSAVETGKALYALSVQMNEEKLSAEEILLPETVDLGSYNWSPINNFQGVITPAETGKPTTIQNLKLSESVPYSESTQFEGSGVNAKLSRYNVYGFINSLSGGTEDHPTTIENLVFKNVTLNLPGSDFNPENTESGQNANVIAPIGAIIPDKVNPGKPVHVAIRNVTVEDCTINGIGRVGGLVGYIGGFSNQSLADGSTVKIEDCTVDSVTATAGIRSPSYGSLGGIVSYIARTGTLSVSIKDCAVKNCTFTTPACVGGAIGWYNTMKEEADGKVGLADIDITNFMLTGNTLKSATEISTTANRGAGLVVGYCTAPDASKQKVTVENFTCTDNSCTLDGSTNPNDNDTQNTIYYTIKPTSEA